MSDAKLDPAQCRRLADDLRANKLGGDLVQWIDRRYLPHDDDTADRVAREIRDDIDGGRCEPLDAFEGPASEVAAQLTAAAEMADEVAALNKHIEDIGEAQERAENNEKEWRQMYLDAFGTRDRENDDLRTERDALRAQLEEWRTVADRLADAVVGAAESPDLALDEYRQLAAGTQPAAHLGPRYTMAPDDTAIIDQALELYSQVSIGAPLEDIARIRATLTGTVLS